MFKDIFGYSAAFMASIMYVPQIKKMYITKSTHDVSINMLSMGLFCSILWIVIITDLIIFSQVLSMLSLKIYHEKLYCCRNRTNTINHVITTPTI